MARTPEQREADKLLNEAIERAIKAYEPDFEALPQEWVLVASSIKPGDAPEDDETFYSVLMTNGGIPWHRAYGLLGAGKRHLDLAEDVNS